MKMRKGTSTLSRFTSLLTAVAFLISTPAALLAQSAGGMLRLYVDPNTHIVYTVPGRNRVLLTEVPTGAASTRALQDQQAKTQQQLDQTQQQVNALAEKNQQLEVTNADLTRQMAQVTPAWRDYIENFQDKFRIGALFYADYRFYTHAGFQPQELTQLTNPGPGNNSYNSFDVTRTYMNMYFFPTKDFTLRLTPNMYKTIGGSASTTASKVGTSTAFGSNLDGNLGVRMKYAYIQYNTLWDKLDVPALKGGTVAFGELPNPLVGWEEDLYGFRYVNLTPWNYMSLSSTYNGIVMEGPIKFGEKTYFEYGFGAYNNASFHSYEQTDTKQAMVRGTLYPFGATWRFQGLGLTGFYNYGYGNTAPDAADLPTNFKSGNGHLERIAALLHYTGEQFGLAGEFDYGVNALTIQQLTSGSAPGDLYGFPTGKQVTTGTFAGNTCTTATSCYNPASGYGAQTGAWTALLNNGKARQIGADLFGHVHIPGTPFTPFGMLQWWQPNDKVPNDPLDFLRFVAGVSYQYNEFLRFAVDSQNVLFYHNQHSMTVAELEKFNYLPGSKLNGILLPKTGSITDLVPWDTHSIFLNMEFSY